MDVQSLAALVSRQTSDLNVYAGFLFAALDRSLPAEYLQVQRRGSVLGRLRGKTPDVIGVSVRLGEKVFALQRTELGGTTVAEIRHEVGGIVLSRQAVELSQWSLALATALHELAAANADAAAALSRLTNFSV